MLNSFKKTKIHYLKSNRQKQYFHRCKYPLSTCSYKCFFHLYPPFPLSIFAEYADNRTLFVAQTAEFCYNIKLIVKNATGGYYDNF